MEKKRKTPVHHTVRRHKRQGKWVDSFTRGSGNKQSTSKRPTLRRRRGVPIYREMERIDKSDVPERDTYDPIYGKGWAWHEKDQVGIEPTLDDLSASNGYDRKELGWLDALLIHRPPKNEIYARRIIPPSRSRPYEVEAYYKLFWLPEKVYQRRRKKREMRNR